MVKQIKINSKHPVFKRKDMVTREYSSNYNKVKDIAEDIIKDIGKKYKEGQLLRYEVTEIVKNAILHGNKMDKKKNIKVSTLLNKKNKLFLSFLYMSLPTRNVTEVMEIWFVVESVRVIDLHSH